MIPLLKKFIKYILYLIIGFTTFVLMYLLSAYCLSRITTGKETGATNDVAIYIKTNGVHTDLVVPVKTGQYDWSQEIKFTNTHLTDTTHVKYLAMGWGDKGFYLQTPTWADLKFSVAFKAAFALSTTAIHATYYDTLVEDSACKRILISNAQYTRLIQYIASSFKHDAAGHVMHIITNINYSKGDAFYEANGSYSLFKTCNTWANTGLKKCGQKACLWTPFDTGIFLKYQ